MPHSFMIFGLWKPSRRLMSSSPSHTTDLLQLLSAGLSASNQAARIVRGVFTQDEDMQIVDKSSPSEKGQDPQTIADLRAQHLIVGSLLRTFPEIKIIGEEGDLEIDQDQVVDLDVNSLVVAEYMSNFSDTKRFLNTSDIVVWVDPLDGTKDFVKGNVEAVTVLIGIAYQGKAVAGIIEQPFGQRLQVWGAVGLGAFGLGDSVTKSAQSLKQSTQKSAQSQIETSAKNESEEKSDSLLRVVTSSNHFTGEIKELVDSLRPCDHVKAGGAGGKILMLLQGKADLYVHPTRGTKKWDSCAGEAVLRAAGGMLTNKFGEDLEYFATSVHPNNEGMFASIGVLHEKYTLSRSKH